MRPHKGDSMRYHLPVLIGVSAISLAGCQGRINEPPAPSALQVQTSTFPEMFTLPIIGYRSPFGQLQPDALSPDDLNAFLAAKLPRPSDTDSKTSLIRLIERATEKE